MNRSNLRRLAIPLASLPPLFTIVFAFSLGPSPRKLAADYFRSSEPAQARLQALEAAGPAVVPAIAERIHEVRLPHRAEAIAFLADTQDRDVLPALERVLTNDREVASLRKQAFEATLALDRRRGLALAENFAGRTDALGEVARQALETQERSSR